MIPSCHAPRPTNPASLHGHRGFTLLDVALAVVCLGLAIYIVTSEVGKIRHRAQRDEFVAELRQLASAFEAYRAQSGEWPPATGGETVIPRGMESALANTHWLSGLPFGGGYEWVPPPPPPPEPVAPPVLALPDLPALPDTPAVAVPPPPPAKPVVEPTPPPPAMIAITACTPRPALALSTADLLYIDAKIDDGNLATGRFRRGFNGWPVYHVTSER